MKTRISLPTLLLLVFTFATHFSFSQIEIYPGPDITPENMVEYLIGPGVYYDNVTFQGANAARGIFSNGSTTNIGIETGIFLTSGAGYNIPGPNTSSSSSSNNGQLGHPLLDSITTATTYDASVLEFDFTPLNDTVKCNFVFGSEEYSEWVFSTFNDVFGFFVNGPKPDSGLYVNYNIALVPGTDTPISINTVNNGIAPAGVPPTGPGTNSEYFVDNTFGTTIEYDGFTTVITLWALVIPDETYHFTIALADVADHIYDSGVLIEGTSFKSLGAADFLSFDFLKEHNPELEFDVIGELINDEVFLEVPPGTNISNLVAHFDVRGVEVFVENDEQEPGVTANDFSQSVNYWLEGYEHKEWTVNVDVVTDIVQHQLQSVKCPNPTVGKIEIKNITGINVKVYNLLGTLLKEYAADLGKSSLEIYDLTEGIYFVQLEKEGQTDVRKIIVN